MSTNSNIPPSRDFDKYFATFQSDPFGSVGLKGINPGTWKNFGPILSSSSGYIEYLEEPFSSSAASSLSGTNSNVLPIGFDFNLNGTTYTQFIASSHGWLALIDPSSTPNSQSLHKIYENRILSGAYGYVNSAITQSFSNNDVLLAPWFDRLLLTHKTLDSFCAYYSGSSSELASQKENFAYGKVSSKDQPFNELDYGMRYAVTDDSVNGKSLVVRWSTIGYDYRSKKLSFEAALYQNGKIEFNYAPIVGVSTDYTLIRLSSQPQNVWKLDESSGATVTDATGGKNLTYKTPSSMIPTSGKINTAAFFSGSNSTLIYADDGAFANYSVTNPFSFSAWFKGALNDSSNKTIVSRMYYDFSIGYALTLAGGNLNLTLSNNFNTKTLQLQSVNNSYNDNQWHHVAFTYDGTATASGSKIYVDGQQIATTTTYNSLTTSDNIQAGSGGADFMIGGIGKFNNNDQRFSGSIDDVARWSTVLTSGDIDLIYQKGLLGVSAADVQPIGLSSTSSATCGIFLSGTSTWNFRDFSPLLGSSLTNRLTSSYGGALFTGSYTDVDTSASVSSSYTVNLDLPNWPARGGRITFSPPTNRRKLIRSDVHQSERKSIFNTRPFDDRKTLAYLEQDNVDAATTLPLSALVNPTYPGIQLKQNLNDINGIKVSNRKVLSDANSFFLEDETELLEKLSPYSEANLMDQGRLLDPFFVTGSISAFGSRKESFSRSLHQKKTLNLSFSVDKKTKMLTSASSIYYFNASANQWNIPTQSLSDHVSSSFSKLSVDTNFAGGTCSGSIFLEDKIAFDSRGNCIASGNLNIFRATSGGTRNQSTTEIGTLFNIDTHASLLIPEYSKSAQRNASYAANNNELFTVPITEPFLIEKATIELPFCMGNGWFSDKTSYLLASASNFAHTASGGGVTRMPSFTFFEEGGPAITVALFCQRNHGTGSVRDLIFKSTFTHVDDQNNSVRFTNIASGSNQLYHIASLQGNQNNKNIISDYVNYQTVNNRKVFTGSVFVKAEVSTTNCAHVGITKVFTMADYANSGSMLSDFENFLNTEFISIDNTSKNTTYLLSIDPFGRSMSGFGAGSVGEYITTAGVLSGSIMRNPYYFSEPATRSSITGSLEANFASLGIGSFLHCMSKESLGKPKQSPYIVYPQDKLILAVSKARPAYNRADIRITDASLTTGKISTLVSSSYFNDIIDPDGHEVFFNTGSINITLYGSTVNQGEESRQ